MIELNVSKFKIKPFDHQIDGVKALLKHSAFALYDSMGLGKSAQVVNAACVLNEAGEVGTVVIVAPASCRGVWADEELGEVKKHSWRASQVVEFHAKGLKEVWRDTAVDLRWIVTNYEFLRSEKNLKELLAHVKDAAGHGVMLVLDEASFIKTRTAKQTKAIAKLRAACSRCVLLNGTPVTNSPLDLWSQMNIMDRSVLAGFKNFWHFRSRYAIMGGWNCKQVLSFHDLDDLSRRCAPYVLRREAKDCLDLPEKLHTIAEVKLDASTWAKYKELKEEAVLALEGYGENAQLEANAAVRLLRLTQLTSGILGGVLPPSAVTIDGPLFSDPNGLEEPVETLTIDVSREKLDWAVEYLTERTQAPAVIVWCRFRRERERLAAELRKEPRFTVVEIFGGQKKTDREDAVRRFTVPRKGGRAVLLAQPHAGGFGLNLVAATEAIYLSNDFSSMMRKQSEDRCMRIGQHHPVTYTDVIATGPAGQRTVDHQIVRALRKYEDVARWTCAEWKKALQD